MSRYTKVTDDNKVLAYGFDHVMGYWYDIQDSETHKIIEEKASFTGASKSEIIEVLSKYKINETHLYALALDLEF